MSQADPNAALIDLAASCHLDPDKWSLAAYDWGQGELSDAPGPRKWQREINRAIRDHITDPETRYQPLRVAVASGHGIGKALSLDAMVPTPSGVRKWGDLAPGDYVFGQGGRPTRVKARRDYTAAPMYRVTFDDGASCDVSSGHLWNVRGRHERRHRLNSWRTMETVEIARAGVKRPNGASQARQWEIPIQGAVAFEKRSLPLHPYLLGVWLGDGAKGSPTYGKPHREIADRIRSLGYEVHSYSGGLSNRVIGCAKMFSGGVFDCGSHERYIPQDYLLSSEDDRMELFKGLCDTDGEANASGSIGYSTTSKRLADDVLFLARSLGCKAMMQPTVKEAWYRSPGGERVDCRDCYRLTINAPFNPFTIKHRRNAYKPSDERYLKRWIDSIEPLDDAACMCITVEAEDGLYQANDFIVTHNSAEMGMLSNWAMSCWTDCKIVITANTRPQMVTKTAPEVGLWFRRSLTAHWFDVQAQSIKSNDPARGDTWRQDFVTWSAHNTEAFAGLHNKGKIIVLMFDEASAIDDKVWEVAEGALTDEQTVIIWLAFGNPTRNSGRFRECFRKYRHRWITKHIDSRTVEGTNKEYLQSIVDDNGGEESDVAKYRVRGQFPSQSPMQFIGEADVLAAQKRHLRPEQYSFAPKIIGVDPAWGGDDKLEIVMRQGLMAKSLATLPKNDNDVEVANLVARFEDEEGADAVFIDAGYGTGIVSAGKTMGRNWRLVWFSGKPIDPGYLNKRAEMWGLMKRWLKDGAAIDPNDQGLFDDLIGPETVPRLDGKIQLESKEDMKQRGIPSPNKADAIAVTFAEPVSKRQPGQQGNRQGILQERYDPHAGL